MKTRIDSTLSGLQNWVNALHYILLHCQYVTMQSWSIIYVIIIIHIKLCVYTLSSIYDITFTLCIFSRNDNILIHLLLDSSIELSIISSCMSCGAPTPNKGELLTIMLKGGLLVMSQRPFLHWPA